MPEGAKSWNCIYPCYIDQKKTSAEGRKIARAKCIDHPTIGEMKEVLDAAGLQNCLEPRKAHPREPSRDAQFQGRVRVRLRDRDTGQPLSENFATKKQLLVHLGQMIPKLKARAGGSTQRGGASASSGAAGGATAAKTQAGKAKKGGKKRR